MKANIRIAAVIVFVLIVGCANMQNSVPEERIQNTQTESSVENKSFEMNQLTTSNGIVYYLAEQSDRDDEPVIILLHGLTGNHADMQEAANFFYNYGYAVVSFDLYGHEGDVYDSDVDLSQMIEGSKNKLEMILGALSNLKICDTDRFGLYGASLGGMTAFYTAAYGNFTPKILISIASSPDFESIFKYTLNYLRSTWSAEEKRFVYPIADKQQELVNWAEENNPLDRTERLAGMTIVMVNGTEDQFMNIDAVRRFVSALNTMGGDILLYENEHGKHDELGDYHSMEIITTLLERMPV